MLRMKQSAAILNQDEVASDVLPHSSVSRSVEDQLWEMLFTGTEEGQNGSNRSDMSSLAAVEWSRSCQSPSSRMPRKRPVLS